MTAVFNQLVTKLQMFKLEISGILPHRHLRSLPRPRLLAGGPHCARIQQRGKNSWA